MTTTARAYAATSASDPLAPTTVERRPVGPSDVLINIAYSGICHSDISTVRGDWGPAAFPLVPGHEIVGTVAEVGPEVTRHAVGDRVGVGCMVNSCRECANCRVGMENYCLNGATYTYGSVDRDGTITQGGYATQVVVVEDFVLSVPESIPFEAAAPLLCAGVTTYSPLAHWKVGAGTRVAVVGMGGLGHMAVKFAHAMGAEVTVLSQSLSKKEDGLRLGADHYYATSDESTFHTLANTFNLIVNTISAQAYLSLLALDGTLVNLGAPAQPLPTSVFALMGNRRSFTASAIGSIAETQEMLDFCGQHGIAPETELIAATDINTAWERVLKSDVRYRFVIDTNTI
jgi:uncharacterized zinc-type alcohol dehydrogenase-like protein